MWIVCSFARCGWLVDVEQLCHGRLMTRKLSANEIVPDTYSSARAPNRARARDMHVSEVQTSGRQ